MSFELIVPLTYMVFVLKVLLLKIVNCTSPAELLQLRLAIIRHPASAVSEIAYENKHLLSQHLTACSCSLQLSSPRFVFQEYSFKSYRLYVSCEGASKRSKSFNSIFFLMSFLKPSFITKSKLQNVNCEECRILLND